MASSDSSEVQFEAAPDGSVVRPILRGRQGSAAEFILGAGAVTRPVRHRQVEEIWHVLAGRGSLWREGEPEAPLHRGVTVCIVAGVAFQFRAESELRMFAVTMPPWPGDEEAESATGPWQPAAIA